MNDKLLKPYDPKETESRIYKLWEESGFFNPDKLPGERKESFTIIMPPPNVTGVLHMGHAMMLTIEDILIRYKRMQGFKTLWLPGTDHAAIATQSVVEKEISKKEGKSRYDLGREELLKRIENFAKSSHDTITSQVRVMGSSCDWSREAFTFDDKRNLAVRTMFKKMYDDGLIYRGHRIVNWDPKGQTTISDDEIVYVEEKTKFYYFKYGPFTIGTARPETKFGDKYVVMHPKDERYKEYTHGQKIDLEWINGPIQATVIKDESIDMEFGTGVMTITPWHSTMDFEIAERHKLDKEQIIDERGKLLPIAGEFAGQHISKARSLIVEKLKQKGLLEKEEDYTHNVATAERTGGMIEPQIKLQWFIDVDKKIPDRDNKSLKELMREPVEKEEIKIIPDYFNKTYFHWIDNLRPWCISRQIWYGHRIPVWYQGNEIYCGVNAPEGDGWVQDEDTLDTWFSSALWTFSTLGWPEKTKDLEFYHPTDVLETGYEILFFWVARMILMTKYAINTIPFHTVYLHGTVRDAQGRKMSKSLGNGIDPIVIAEKFGADAGRMALIVGTAPGTDSRISEDKIKGYKHFANKLWNISRFILTNTNEEGIDTWKLNPADKKILDELDEKINEITKEMDEYKFYIAGEKIYHYIWHEFADKILEDSKPLIQKIVPQDLDDTKRILTDHMNPYPDTRGSRQKLLKEMLRKILIILHPFMPFVTEEIWSILPQKEKNLLLVEQWPLEASI
ncbi:MAG: valine--tRNA ligase [Candidatus Pacebacteria bacterium]|nr:valine--tRNA ligase [Candidatus Paceibacterota bacterium]